MTTRQSPEALGQDIVKNVFDIIMREVRRKSKSVSPDKVLAEAMKEAGAQ